MLQVSMVQSVHRKHTHTVSKLFLSIELGFFGNRVKLDLFSCTLYLLKCHIQHLKGTPKIKLSLIPDK